MLLAEQQISAQPDRMVLMTKPNLQMNQYLANLAVDYAKRRLPKISGNTARSIQPIFGETYWGLYFPDKIAWYLERGINPFTMNNLAGKVIPMWVDDPYGEEAKKDPKAKTRMTADGRLQTLIFRRAARHGQRKTVRRGGQFTTVPMSYPGAPGRIGNPRANGGRIAAGNVGVRWRHPGTTGKGYLNSAMADALFVAGLDPTPLFLVDAPDFITLTRA